MIQSIVFSALPLLYGIKNFESALMFSSSVLMSVFFTEFFWLLPAKLHAPLKTALGNFILTSCALAVILFAGEYLWGYAWNTVAPVFSLAFAGAFSLVQAGAPKTTDLASRSRLWAGFALLVLVYGAWCEAGALFQGFPPAPLWLGALALVIPRFFKKGAAP